MKKWSIYIWFMILAAACTTDEQPVNPTEPKPVEGTEEVTLRLAFPGENSTDTRAFTLAEENKIDSLRIFVFKDGGTGNRLNDIYMYTVVATNIVSGPPITADVKFKSTTYKQRIMAVANMPVGLFTTLTLSEGVTTAKDILGQLTFKGEPWQKNVETGDKAFPMFGQLTDFKDVGVGAVDPFPNPIDIPMIRAVAKVEIGVDVNNNTGDPALGFGSYFKIHTVYVCNASNHGYIAPDSSLLKTSTFPPANITKPNYFDGTGITPPLPARKDSIIYSFPEVVAHVVPQLERTIYIPESDTFSTLVTNPIPKTFLIVKATYYGDTAFYRLDFVKDHQYAHILRNHSYKFNITGLRKMGYPTLEEAYLSPALTTLNPHLILDNADADIKEIVYNKDYYLGVSTTTLHADQSRHYWSTTNQSIPLQVKTSYQGGLDVNVTGGNLPYLWVTPASVHVDANNLQTVNIGVAIYQSTNGQPRTGEITVKAGELVQKIKVIQSAGSYSYIYKRGDTDDGNFSVSSASIDGTSKIGLGDTAVLLYGYSISLVTTTVSNDINASIRFEISKTVTGPSIIGLMKKATGKIIWSWLVWVVPDIDRPTYFYNGYEFMADNLGSSFDGGFKGPFFQWGRKDALFPDSASRGFKIAEAYASNSLDSTIANPLTFYYNPILPFDWKRDWQNNNLWIDANGEKTAYDPCPFGWRVPPAVNNAESPWNGFVNGRNGLYFNENTGFDGVSGSPTSNGFVWSASSRNSYAYGFRGVPAGAQNLNRANGHAVRCVRDNIRRIQ